MDWPQIPWMLEAGRSKQLRQRMQRVVVIVVNAIDLVRHVKGAVANRILRGDAGRTAVGVAAQGLDAPQSKHEAARRIAPVGADRHRARHVECGRDLARRADLDPVTRVDADQGVVNEADALAHRHAQMVHEFERRRTGAALIAVDHDEVGVDAGFKHRLADRQELPAVSDTHFESGRLAAGELSHFADELHHLDRRRECIMLGRRNAVLAHRDAPDLGNLFGDLCRRQDAAMPGLGTLADLELDHLDLVAGCDPREFFRVERAVAIAAAEIAGTDLPDDVAAILAVIGADPAFTGIMREFAFLGAGIERSYRIGTERAKTHRRDIEHGGRIGLRAIRSADGDAELLARRTHLRRHRMMHPFVTLAVHILLGSERPLVEHHLGTLIDHRAGIAREGHAVLLALEEILPHLRADLFEQKAHMRCDRIVTQDRVALLEQVADAEQRQSAENKQRNEDDVERLGIVIEDTDAEQQCRHDGANRQDDVAWRERKHQRFHGSPSGQFLPVLLSSDPGHWPPAPCRNEPAQAIPRGRSQR